MNIKAIIMIGLGFVLLVLGAIGLFLPILPTTPFVLCSVGCFAGSPRLRSGVLKINFVREYYDNYQNKCGLPKKTVISSLVFLWGMLSISCIITQKLWLTFLLFSIGTAVTFHILHVARKRPDKKQNHLD